MSIEQRVSQECVAMLNYALGIGLKIPDDVIETIQNYQRELVNIDENGQKKSQTISIVDLNRAHNSLAKIVQPAKPHTLLLFEKDESKSFFRFLGPVPLARKMILIAVLSLVLLIALGVSSYVDGSSKSFSLTQNDGISLLYNQLFLISAAAIGASFAALFKVNEFIKNATYDPMYESTYWVRFVLGILAGSMLATLIPLDTLDTSAKGFGRPLLSLIGGFSAAVVFRILTRLVSAVESVFKGDAKEILESTEMINSMRLEEQKVQNKLELLNELKNLQSKISLGGDTKELQDEINKIQSRLLDEK